MKKCNKCFKCKQHPKGVSNKWDPLLLIIPLRLGLNEFNLDYKEPIKVRIIDFFFVSISPSINYFFNKKKNQKCLELKQTVGMIGGKPNQAYYFYGYAGIYRQIQFFSKNN